MWGVRNSIYLYITTINNSYNVLQKFDTIEPMEEKRNKNELIISWVAYDKEEKVHGRDWFWAVGIIAVSLATAMIIYNNIVLAIFILIATAVLVLFAVKKPEEVTYGFSDNGFMQGNIFYPYRNIKSFAIDYSEKVPQLLLHLDRVFLPIITIPFAMDTDTDEIRDAILEVLPEEDLHEPKLHKILEKLGF
jgi:hypothetical protein